MSSIRAMRIAPQPFAGFGFRDFYDTFEEPVDHGYILGTKRGRADERRAFVQHA